MRYRNRNRFYTAYGGRYDNRNPQPGYGQGPRMYRDQEPWEPNAAEYRGEDIYDMERSGITDIYNEYEPYSMADNPSPRSHYRPEYQGYFGLEEPSFREEPEIHSSYQRHNTRGEGSRVGNGRGGYRGDSSGGYRGAYEDRLRGGYGSGGYMDEYEGRNRRGYGSDYGAEGYAPPRREEYPGPGYRNRLRDEGGYGSNYKSKFDFRRNLPDRPRHHHLGVPHEERWEVESQFDEKGRGLGNYRYDDLINRQRFWE